MMTDSLGDRMKRYESVPRVSLMRRTPVILRFDGKAFHTLTRGLDKPWDNSMENAMWHAAESLCVAIQGAKFAYVQSDEISVLCTDYEQFDTQAWFDYDLQKIVSVGAAICTRAFNSRLNRDALFDGRAFNMPKEEVVNYFVWRQQDATRNSIQGLGQAHFGHKQLHGKSCDEIQEMLFQVHGLNWNDIPTWRKRGCCITRKDGYWLRDPHPPIFTQDRNYVEKHLLSGELDANLTA